MHGWMGRGWKRSDATPPRQPFTRQVANVLGCLPKSVHAGARKALAEVATRPTVTRPSAPSRRSRVTTASSGPRRWPRSPTTPTSCLRSSTSPAEHWGHLKTSNPIESTFSSVRLRTRVTKGPGSKAAGLAMAVKLLEAAQDRWRAVNGPHLVALVRAGARFDKGVMVERPDDPREVAA
jgi:putative transposase